MKLGARAHNALGTSRVRGEKGPGGARVQGALFHNILLSALPFLVPAANLYILFRFISSSEVT